jgi:hypothetical protein
MSSINCHEISTDEHGDSVWTPVEAPDCISRRFGKIVLELAAGDNAMCNGIAVVDIQALESGDVVRIRPSGAGVRCLLMGTLRPQHEPGAGRLDSFTGLPIEADALCCNCGEIYDAQRTAPQIKNCINCRMSLSDAAEFPSEDLL